MSKKKITRTITVYQTESNGVIMNHFTMESAMKHIKTGASYLGEKEFLQYMDIDTWNANCEMVEKEAR